MQAFGIFFSETRSCLASNYRGLSDGRGRALDHVCVERLWRMVKSEAVSLRDDQRMRDARQGLTGSVACYHHERLHQARGY